ncbi:hypothetical protein KMW28_17525 [Flammeovirga yaeyamensis]|uniref:Apea-like HEPN domain-containing protein n=1 Tax=Flammeovirga yaeyamensis TaxID=367791 RepID=A0AAX1N5I6_9BACT|nr:HEPN domain-containing protein [Flammeovirga yaeyamensis]MBB3698177.1 hypothetical protein [Flammeovirga yaeyamensis]NMF34466.1 hypothetical protein [Flammeovirga yaeyamensis]QWG01445.1 hypothetical protein KMW28_17525 [Flammeovirga yaeyamensis]
MLQRDLEILRHYLGVDLLRYTINYPNLQEGDNLEKLDLNNHQEIVLERLSSLIRKIRLDYIDNKGIGDGVEHQLHRINPTLFVNFRKLCGGEDYKSKWENDAVMQFLFLAARKNYPILLINNQSAFKQQPIFSDSQASYEEFIRIVKDDILNNLTNGKEGFDYRFQFTTQCGFKSLKQVSSAYNTIIIRSFMNCCNEMFYDFDSLMTEIEKSISLLRDLARKKEVEFKSYVCLRGISFLNFKELNLRNAQLKQLPSLSALGIHTKSVGVKHTTHISGGILKVIHNTRIEALDSDVSNGLTNDQHDHQNKIVDAFKFALIFAYNETDGISACIFESGFPLLDLEYISNRDRPKKYYRVKSEDIPKIIEWFDLFYNNDIKSLEITLKRLESAIFANKTPEDSIVDAFIAWESMFSGRGDTTIKVTGSIAKFLKNDFTERENLYKELKKLYNLRSEIVHGKPKKSKELEKENIRFVRKRIISIGIECLSKLLKDEDLLKLDPEKRVNKVLLMN